MPPLSKKLVLSKNSVLSKNLMRPCIAVAVIALSSSYAFAQKPPTPSRIRGTIESINGDVLMVKSRSGEDEKLQMNDATKVLGITKVSLADVKVGSFIGATTVPGPDGKPKAIEVHVFPESMRGTGEGSRPWDLGTNSSMTNATVAESVAANDGRTLTVKYKGGEKQVEISPDTPIVTYVPGNKSELKAGAKVIAFVKARPDGSFDTDRVSVGLDGLTPPM
jgi:hypothetical protein